MKIETERLSIIALLPEQLELLETDISQFERILGCDNDIMELKSHVKEYPAALKTAIIWRDVYFAQFRH